MDRAQSKLQTGDLIDNVNSALKNIEAAMRVGSKSAIATEPIAGRVHGVSFGVPGTVLQGEDDDEADQVAADLLSGKNFMFGERHANADADAVDFDSDAGSDVGDGDDVEGYFRIGQPVSRAASRSVLWSLETTASDSSPLPDLSLANAAESKLRVAPLASSSIASLSKDANAAVFTAAENNPALSRQLASVAPVDAQLHKVVKSDVTNHSPSKSAPDRSLSEYDENLTEFPSPEELVFVPGACWVLMYEHPF
jgi:hypothetical protein